MQCFFCLFVTKYGNACMHARTHGFMIMIKIHLAELSSTLLIQGMYVCTVHMSICTYDIYQRWETWTWTWT